MLQQDYFLRLIREFFAALQRALETNEIEDRTKAIHELYDTYLGSYERCQNATVEEAIDYISTIYPEEQQMYRLEMLAELYYAEADLRMPPFRETLLKRALSLFEFIDRHSGVYSVMRLQKIDAIRQRLSTAKDKE